MFIIFHPFFIHVPVLQTLSLPLRPKQSALWGHQAWMEVMGMDQNSSPTTQMARPMKRRCRMESSGSCTFSQMMASAWDLNGAPNVGFPMGFPIFPWVFPWFSQWIPETAFGKQLSLREIGWFLRLVETKRCLMGMSWTSWWELEYSVFEFLVGWDCWAILRWLHWYFFHKFTTSF